MPCNGLPLFSGTGSRSTMTLTMIKYPSIAIVQITPVVLYLTITLIHILELSFQWWKVERMLAIWGKKPLPSPWLKSNHVHLPTDTKLPSLHFFSFSQHKIPLNGSTLSETISRSYMYIPLSSIVLDSAHGSHVGVSIVRMTHPDRPTLVFIWCWPH